MEQNFELNKQAFGAFLAQLRREKGWTQKDLAEKLYVSDKAVSKWERGLSVPDVSLLLPLAELLGVSVGGGWKKRPSRPARWKCW